MAYFDKIGRLVKLVGILGLSAGSLFVSACGGRSAGSENHNNDFSDGSFLDAELDANLDAEVDAGEDASLTDADMHNDGEPPDAELWDVICE